ncbi:PilZ domain-containing protein [Pseudoduganella sp. GCM10020061]|uniref:PilZ domain-containing protein n=1 Tax=Pseudoduganella sp. GCM10020061 TaxID=3317345 RepID=UPI00362A035F
MLPTIERRGGQRKPMKTKALISVDSKSPVWVRTVDLSENGVGLATPEPVRIGAPARVRFELSFDGQSQPVEARGTIAYCMLSGDEFKVGITFTQVDVAAMMLISKFLK